MIERSVASCSSERLLSRVRHIASGLMGLRMADKIEGDDKGPTFGSFCGREEGGCVTVRNAA